MIFGNKYDLSLWYMLKVKNLYSKKTIDFVKELPEEFLENIRAAYIKGIDNNIGLDNDKDPFYNIKSSAEPNTYYKFYIMCKDLYMYKIQAVDGVDKKVFSLVLSPNDSNGIMDLKNNHGKPLGSICMGEYPEISFKEVDYNLKKTELGYMLSYSYVLLRNTIEMTFIRPTSIKYMPEEMYRDKSYSKKLIKLPPKDDNK